MQCEVAIVKLEHVNELRYSLDQCEVAVVMFEHLKRTEVLSGGMGSGYCKVRIWQVDYGSL